MATKKSDIDWTWEQAKPVRGKNPDVYRRDELGNEMFRPSYGKAGEKSWEVDHRRPVSKAGSDHRRNLRALNVQANREKSDGY